MARAKRRSFLFSIPVVGYVLRCFAEERLNEIALLILNFIMAGAVIVLLLGYPGLITLALVLAGLAGVLVIATTRG